MTQLKKLPDKLISDLDSSKIIGVRSGTEHKFTGVWPVVVEGRLFVRSWNDKPSGWYRAFMKEPDGFVQLGLNVIPVRARAVRSPRLRAAVTMAYTRKYNTKGSIKWVQGFSEDERARKTIEFIGR